MRRLRWIRNRPGPEENRVAAGISLGVGAAVALVVFYFARIFLSRERLEPSPETDRPRRLELPPEKDRKLEPAGGEGESTR